MWTLTYAQPATPTLLDLPLQSGEKACTLYLAHHFLRTVQRVETSQHYIVGGFGVILLLHRGEHVIIQPHSHEFTLSCFSVLLFVTICYILCILYLCYEARKKTLVFMQPALNWPELCLDSVSHTQWWKLLTWPSGYQQVWSQQPKSVLRQNLKCRTTLCVPPSIRAVPSDPDGQLRLYFLCDFNLRIQP